MISISCILNITKVEFHLKKIFVILSFNVAFVEGLNVITVLNVIKS